LYQFFLNFGKKGKIGVHPTTVFFLVKKRLFPHTHKTTEVKVEKKKEKSKKKLKKK